MNVRSLWHFCFAVVLLTLQLLSFSASAHNLNFGTLTVSESTQVAKQFKLTFQVSGDQGSHVSSLVGLPAGCGAISESERTDKIRRRILQTLLCETSGFEDKQFQLIDMPPNSRILVRALRGNELIKEQMLNGETPYWQLNGSDSEYSLVDYINLGVVHILVGWDHLVFLLMLILLIPIGWKLVQVITAFTIGHSITLGMATVGVINIPIAPTEALIALSIVFLAAEIIRYQRDKASTLTTRYPGTVTSLFGLFHGLGFASVLSDIGVPEDQILGSLIGFNLGVELGQLLFVGLALLVAKLIKSLHISRPVSPSLLAYTGGVVGAFWLVERVSGF